MDIYVQENGRKISKKGNSFLISSSEKETAVSSEMIETIILEGRCSITSEAISLAIEKGIPIIISNYQGKVQGRFWEHRLGGSSEIRRKQCKYFDTKLGVEIGKEWIVKKINSQLKHLEKIEGRRKDLDISKEKNSIRESIGKIESLTGDVEKIRNIIMGYEGNSSRNYYSVIGKTLPERWGFEKREQQESKNPYNIVLNYLFGVLYIKCEHALVKAGLDPYIGILHSDGYNKKSLLFDFIEQFRFLAWETAFVLFSRKKIASNHFVKVDEELTLSSEARRELVKSFQEKLEFEIGEEKENYLEIIVMEARKLARKVEVL